MTLAKPFDLQGSSQRNRADLLHTSQQLSCTRGHLEDAALSLPLEFAGGTFMVIVDIMQPRYRFVTHINALDSVVVKSLDAELEQKLCTDYYSPNFFSRKGSQ
jgi:hypothetical protein